jgi:hypothetical protein
MATHYSDYRCSECGGKVVTAPLNPLSQHDRTVIVTVIHYTGCSMIQRKENWHAHLQRLQNYR